MAEYKEIEMGDKYRVYQLKSSKLLAKFYGFSELVI